MSNNHGDIVIAAPAGYKWVEGTLTKITYVAEAGDVKYESLQKAIDAAKSKAVVTMLADTRENVTISTPLQRSDAPRVGGGAGREGVPLFRPLRAREIDAYTSLAADVWRGRAGLQRR